MLLFVDYIEAKQISAPALISLVDGPSKLHETSGAQMVIDLDLLRPIGTQ